MDTVAVYGRWQHIPHVVGRVDYLTNPERQECLLAVGGELDRTFWARLAADCQQAWRESGGSREKTVTKYQRDRTKKLVSVEKQACEAREIQLLLPRKVLQMGKEAQEKLLEDLAEEEALELIGLLEKQAVNAKETGPWVADMLKDVLEEYNTDLAE